MACLDSNIKYGCALWDMNKCVTIREDLDKIKPNLVKRVLELPFSTPSVAVQYEFGINNLSLDVLLEKVVLTVKTLKLDNNRISKQLLEKLMKMKVTGYCSEVEEACKILQVKLDVLIKCKNVRKVLKKVVVKLQGDDLLRRMLLNSKTDKVLLNGFQYDGLGKKYLSELHFNDARLIFMARYRMLPTKCNFPGRWGDTCCNVCGSNDTDEHIISCPGYSDIVDHEIHYTMLWNKKVLNDMDLLRKIAKNMKILVERMEEIQRIG